MKEYKISAEEFSKASFSRLATRPNNRTAVGEGHMSAEELKKRFDKQGELFRAKFNALISIINNQGEGDSLSDFVHTRIFKDHTLTMLLDDIVSDSGKFASYLSVGDMTLIEKINEIYKNHSDHANDQDNPHNVTKKQVGLENVDDTSDAEKPVSAAQQAALDGKVDKIMTDGKTSVVYGVTSAGKNTAFEMIADKWKYSVPFRNNDRTFEIGDPVKDSNPVTLAYLKGVVDGLVGKVGNQMIDGSLSIKGDLFIEGSTYGTDVESLNVKDAVIVANADGVPLAELSGYVIRVSDEQAYGILYDPAEGCVKIGLGAFDGNVFTYGEEEAQVLATRDRIEGGNFPVWDSEHHTFVDSGKCVSDFMSKKDFNTYNENIEAALDEIIEIQEALINQYREESE